MTGSNLFPNIKQCHLTVLHLQSTPAIFKTHYSPLLFLASRGLPNKTTKPAPIIGRVIHCQGSYLHLVP